MIVTSVDVEVLNARHLKRRFDQVLNQLTTSLWLKQLVNVKSHSSLISENAQCVHLFTTLDLNNETIEGTLRDGIRRE